ncbi:MAG: hypothetical protein R3194_12905, partial [Limnobacter sp.]|nr:hypothetical protein [Limnobacter sp.]
GTVPKKSGESNPQSSPQFHCWLLVDTGGSGTFSFFDGTLTVGGLRGGVAMFLQYNTEQVTKNWKAHLLTSLNLVTLVSK